MLRNWIDHNVRHRSYLKNQNFVRTCGYVKGRQQQHIKYFLVIPIDVDLFFYRFITSQRCTKENDSFPRQLPDIEIILRLLAASLTCLMSASLKSLFFDEMDLSFRSSYLRVKFNFFLQF